MLKRLINGEIAVGFAFATLFWIVVVGWTTSYSPTDSEKEACYQAAARSGRNTDECEAFWKKTTSDPVALFTLVLAFSTVGLWIATLGLYFAGKRQLKLAKETSDRQAIEIQNQIDIAKVSARATKESADAAIALERPRLWLSKTYIAINAEDDGQIVCRYSIQNYGRTPAILESYDVNLRCYTVLPGVPDYRLVFPLRRVLHQREEMNDLQVTSLAIDRERIGTLGSATEVFLFGNFRYRDVFGATIITGFGYRCSLLTGHLIETGEAYNYDRRENTIGPALWPTPAAV
jgi:hypothetical protein